MSQANTWHEEYFQDIIVDPDNILKPFDADEPLIKIYDNLPVYCARIDNQVFVVFGREKFGPYDDVKFFKENFIFFANKKLHYVAKISGKYYVFSGNDRSQAFDQVQGFCIRDDKPFYKAMVEEKWHVRFGDCIWGWYDYLKPNELFDVINCQPVFIAGRRSKEFLVKGKIIGPEYDKIGWVVIDGDTVVYAAELHGKCFIVYSDKPRIDDVYSKISGLKYKDGILKFFGLNGDYAYAIEGDRKFMLSKSNSYTNQIYGDKLLEIFGTSDWKKVRFGKYTSPEYDDVVNAKVLEGNLIFGAFKNDHWLLNFNGIELYCPGKPVSAFRIIDGKLLYTYLTADGHAGYVFGGQKGLEEYQNVAIFIEGLRENKIFFTVWNSYCFVVWGNVKTEKFDNLQYADVHNGKLIIVAVKDKKRMVMVGKTIRKYDQVLDFIVNEETIHFIARKGEGLYRVKRTID